MSDGLDSAGKKPAAAGTRWQRVLDDSEWRRPLSELAASYYYCVYVWWRRAGLDAVKASTATVASFNRWLTDSRPSRDQPGAKRLREWLPCQLAELAAKGVKLTAPPEIQINTAWCEQRYAKEPPGDPDAVLARRWALTMLEYTVVTIRKEYEARGEEAFFSEILSFAGYEGSDHEHFTEVAARTGRSVGVIQKAAFDFRQRQRELLLSLARDTLLDPRLAESEMAAFLGACNAAGPGAASAAMPTVMGRVRPEEMLARAMQSAKFTGQGGAEQWGAPTVEEAARLFPQHEIISLLGRGGMGVVYKARQPALDRLVAIKLLPMEVSADPAFAARFQRESRAMAKLQHQNILGVYDSGTTSEGHLYFVMEYFEGANLQAMIHGPGLTPGKSLEIAAAVCDALAYAHGQGVVHRDIKPANIRVSAAGQVKVTDFGLARLTVGDGGRAPSGWTLSGTAVGTADYMAPEQKRGKTVDGRADIYSLGVVLYEMLCREAPQGVFEPPSARVAVDPRIDQVVIKALQQQPERRYQSAREMNITGAPGAGATAPAAKGGQADAAKPVQVSAAPSPKPFRWKPAQLAGVGLGVAALAIVGFVCFGGKKSSPAVSTAPPAPPILAGPPATPSPLPSAKPTAKPAAEKIAAATPAKATPATVSSPIAASKAAPFADSLGIQFVPVPIVGGPTAKQRVLFSVWDTRVQDYETFARETKRKWPKPPFKQTPKHPAVNVTWEDAKLFCEWLTAREHAAGRLPVEWGYRLPSDHEWSCAVGLSGKEDAAQPPIEKSGQIHDVFPWGKQWPPPSKAGNFASEELRPLLGGPLYSDLSGVIDDYRDGNANTSPVGSYPANRLGLFDLAGNVWQWCGDWYDRDQQSRVQRGASWTSTDRGDLLSSHRHSSAPTVRAYDVGFRCVAALLSDTTPPIELASAAKTKLPAAPAAPVATPAQAKPPIATPAPSPMKAPPPPESASFAPELAPLAAKYDADLAAVETQKKATQTRAEQEYLAALEFAEKSAGSAGDVKTVAAIEKERGDIKAHPELAARLAGELPDSLQPARKALLAALAAADAEAYKRGQKFDSDYLRTLTMLEPKAAAGSPLAQQIAAEKGDLIRKASEPPPGAAPTALPGESEQGLTAPHGEKVLNGNFTEVDAKGFPKGWSLYGHLDSDGVYPDGVSLQVVKENDLSFVRMSFEGRYHDIGVEQRLDVPHGAHTAYVRVRFRGKVTGRLDTANRATPYFFISFQDESGHGIWWTHWNPHIVDLETSFVTFQRTITIPKGAITADFRLSNGNCNGTFDFTHASANFR